MIEIIPAIDLIEGRCVRLSQGSFTEKTVYPRDPVDMAMWFMDNRFRRLHMVDLDGAGQGRMQNLNILEKIAAKTSLLIDYGGGVKTMKDAETVLENGAAMVCLGSMAVVNPGEFLKVLQVIGRDRVILASDIKNGTIAVSGWKEESGIDPGDFLRENVSKGVRTIMCTDISRDGMFTGPAFDLYSRLKKDLPGTSIIASGGVSSEKDIEKLDEIGVSGVVVGKAFYENRIGIKELKKYLI